MKATLKKFAVAGAALAAPAFAFADGGAGTADVAGIVTSASTLLTSIYPIVIGAVGFGILVSLVKMVRRK